MGAWWGERLSGWIGTHREGCYGERGLTREGDLDGMSGETQCGEEKGGIWGGGAERHPSLRCSRADVGRATPLWDWNIYSERHCPHECRLGQGRGRDGRCHDPCHPLSGLMSMRMPMRTSLRRRAGSGAPPCDPACLWPPVLIPLIHSSAQGSSVMGQLLQPTPPHPPCTVPAKVRTQTVSRLGFSWRPGVSHPVQFRRPPEGDSQISTEHPAHISSPSCGNGPYFCEINIFVLLSLRLTGLRNSPAGFHPADLAFGILRITFPNRCHGGLGGLPRKPCLGGPGPPTPTLPLFQAAPSPPLSPPCCLASLMHLALSPSHSLSGWALGIGSTWKGYWVSTQEAQS